MERYTAGTLYGHNFVPQKLLETFGNFRILPVYWWFILALEWTLFQPHMIRRLSCNFDALEYPTSSNQGCITKNEY